MRIIGVVGGPEARGRTSAADAGVLAGTGASTSLVELSATPVADVVAAISAADAVVFGSPVYRATYSALLKDLAARPRPRPAPVPVPAQPPSDERHSRTDLCDESAVRTAGIIHRVLNFCTGRR